MDMSLVLSRRIGESILIGENIRVVITAIAGNQVRIGIDAPKDVPILREELLPRDPTEGEGEI
jgi:carbon storage regulator